MLSEKVLHHFQFSTLSKSIQREVISIHHFASNYGWYDTASYIFLHDVLDMI